MSETPRDYAVCHNCGALLPHGARFCPTCGAQVIEATPASTEQPASDDAFRNAIDAALGTSSGSAEQPTVQAPIVGPAVPESVEQPEIAESQPTSPTWSATPDSASYPPMQQPAWTASSEQWPADVSTHNQPGWRRSRTTWVILAIVGFIIFCCCGILFALFVAASFDDSFQSEISLIANALV